MFATPYILKIILKIGNVHQDLNHSILTSILQLQAADFDANAIDNMQLLEKDLNATSCSTGKGSSGLE